MVSNDLCTPLRAVKEAMTILEIGTEGHMSDAARREASSIGKNTDTLINLVTNLLEMHKLDAGTITLESESSSLETIIGESVALVRDFAESKKIAILIPSGNWSIICDPQKVRQTIVNLLSNAIKFSPENSPVTIDVVAESNSFEIRITDSGPGVPEPMRHRIFEPYEQVASDSGQGTGLAICKMIVEAHGGTIGVRPAAMAQDLSSTLSELKPSSGSIFWFRLPETLASPVTIETAV
jgi:signal transduction histidine kinase